MMVDRRGTLADGALADGALAPAGPSASRLPPLIVLLGSGGALAGALFFQYVVGLPPCVLCLWQRWPHGVAIVLSLLALVASGRRARGVLLAGAGTALVVGAGIALFHVGVEQHWWAGTAECGSTLSANSVEALRAQILAAPVVRCDQPAWSLLGISMAGYNALISAALAVVALTAAVRARP